MCWKVVHVHVLVQICGSYVNNGSQKLERDCVTGITVAAGILARLPPVNHGNGLICAVGM